jgi:hypothetical protein
MIELSDLDRGTRPAKPTEWWGLGGLDRLAAS